MTPTDQPTSKPEITMADSPQLPLPLLYDKKNHMIRCSRLSKTIPDVREAIAMMLWMGHDPGKEKEAEDELDSLAELIVNAANQYKDLRAEAEYWKNFQLTKSIITLSPTEKKTFGEILNEHNELRAEGDRLRDANKKAFNKISSVLGSQSALFGYGAKNYEELQKSFAQTLHQLKDILSKKGYDAYQAAPPSEPEEKKETEK